MYNASMKKRYLVLVLIVAFGFTYTWFVRNASKPLEQATTSAPVPTLAPEAAPAQKDDLILVNSPRPNAQVASPIVITGKARGNWYFEGSFPIVLTNWDGLIIAEGYATAQGEWMTTEYVPFTASLSYTLAPETPYRRGFLILKKNNVSDERHLDNAIEIPVTL